MHRSNPPDVAREILQYADLALDIATRQARRGERVIILSTIEYEVSANPRVVLTGGLLMEHIWGLPADPMSWKSLSAICEPN